MAITISEKKIEDKDQNLLDTLNMVYPVGSIYMSVNSTSPASLFGGTWERLKDVFLLAAGDTYAAGSTGGEATHTLTVNEMPAHTHEVAVRVQGYGGWENYTSYDYGVMFKANDTVGYHGPNYTAHSAVVTADANTGGSGGSKPHNNMPPYLAIYMWKRVS